MKGKYVKSSLYFDHDFLTKTSNDKRILQVKKYSFFHIFLVNFFLIKYSLICLI